MYLINNDCREVFKRIPDNSIDLIIIDPPYEFVKNKSSFGGSGTFGSRDYYKELKENNLINGLDINILNELVRIMKKVNIYIWCSKEQIYDYLDFFKNYNFDLLCWHKTNPTPTCNNSYLSDTEYLLYFREKGVKLYGTYYTKRKYYITSTNKKDKELYKHPTIKPLDIIENLVINSSKENDLILDCFMGSGTTGVACKKLKREFIGVEINKEYFEIAKNRINREEA